MRPRLERRKGIGGGDDADADADGEGNNSHRYAVPSALSSCERSVLRVQQAPNGSYDTRSSGPPTVTTSQTLTADAPPYSDAFDGNCTEDGDFRGDADAADLRLTRGRHGVMMTRFPRVPARASLRFSSGGGGRGASGVHHGWKGDETISTVLPLVGFGGAPPPLPHAALEVRGEPFFFSFTREEVSE